MIPVAYRGSVKDVLGPVQMPAGKALIFQFTDAYSVFDWGRMPDHLPQKGEALAVLAGSLFEMIETPQAWKDFSRTPAAQGLRRGMSQTHAASSGAFNELGERLQSEGQRTHYLGFHGTPGSSPLRLDQLEKPSRELVVRAVEVKRPVSRTVLGREILDYAPTRGAELPRLIPLEVVFRFGFPPGSSALERIKNVTPVTKLEFPMIEFFTKLETSDRLVSMTEALAISGLTVVQMEDLVFRSAWVAGMLKSVCDKVGLELADGKLEWALTQQGLMLVDAIGPDELRLLKDGIQISKEYLRAFYRTTHWYGELTKLKASGLQDWKKKMSLQPPGLGPELRELGTQLYQALSNQLTGRTFFKNAWSLTRVAEEMRRLAR